MKRNIKTKKIGSSTNLFILFLVSVPLIGFLFLEPILANIISQTFDMNINDVYNSTFLWIALYALLNGFLAELDNKQLNKNRININNAFSWALILVPVYLYKRGSILNKTYKNQKMHLFEILKLFALSFFSFFLNLAFHE